MKKELRAGLLGATGAVGQRYVNMLSRHPYIKLEVLLGGESAGKKYADAAKWLFPEPIPEEIGSKVIQNANPESTRGCDVVFSALPSEIAKEAEPRFAEAGQLVISEASAHRMEPDVPLMIPEVNAEHLKLLETQRKRRGWKRGIVATPNCTVTGLAIVIKPIVQSLQMEKAVVTTMQAVSGAGYPGVSSLLIVENVIPYIQNEEEKVANEARKILGRLKNGGIEALNLPMGLSCNRVPVIDGHMETMYCEFSRNVEPAEVVRELEGFRGPPQKLRLPTAPDLPIIVRKEKDRPQPRLDRMAGSVPGMSVVVGRVRRGIDERAVQLTLLSHNTIRGAAGTAILTCELMQAEGFLE